MWGRYIQLKSPILKIKKYFDFRKNENINYESCPICGSISYKKPNHGSFIEVRCIDVECLEFQRMYMIIFLKLERIGGKKIRIFFSGFSLI